MLRLLERQSPLRYLVGVAAPLAATGLGLAIGTRRTAAAALVYILAVVGAAGTGGLAPGVVASMLSFLGLNFFFTPPHYTFAVDKADDLVALVVFLSVGMVVSTLVARGLAQRARAERREYETRTLYAISTRLLTGEDLDAAFAELARLTRRLFGLARCEVRTLTPDSALELRAADGEDEPAAERVEIPLIAGERDLGVLVLVPGSGGLGEAERRVATILAGQTASALERAILEREAREARVAAEANRVRRALLSAVSHDFRTPLSSIKAAVTALLAPGGPPPGAAARELLETAAEETDRLERLVTNLLDLTRIRSGALAPERVPLPVEAVLEDALAGLRRQLEGRRVDLVIRPDLPAVSVDPVQVAQVFRNVIENATKFAPPGTPIRIAASRWHDAVEVRVSDRGPGIPASERSAVFEEFYRGGDGRTGGTGLGLAVAKAIARAHTGDIWIEETPGGGATVAVRLPATGAAS